MNDTLKDFLKKVQELEVAARRLAEKNPRAFDTPGYREYEREFHRPEDGPFIFSPERGWWFLLFKLSSMKKYIAAAMKPPSKVGRFMIEKKGNVFYLRQEKAASVEAKAGDRDDQQDYSQNIKETCHVKND